MTAGPRTASVALALLGALALGAWLSAGSLLRPSRPSARTPATAGGAAAAAHPEPPVELPRQATAFLGAAVKPDVPATPRDAQSALARVQFARAQQPPFGPSLVPRSALSGSDAWERDYYAHHPEEYERFVALWGDVHGLRK